MTGLQRPLNMLSATVSTESGERTLDYLAFAAIDGGEFGRTCDTGFLVDGKIDDVGSGRWVRTLLAVGRGRVKIEGRPREQFDVTFRLADPDERLEAWQHIHEVRPNYNAGMDPGGVRVILVKLAGS